MTPKVTQDRRGSQGVPQAGALMKAYAGEKEAWEVGAR
jgi:hypothetical protein